MKTEAIVYITEGEGQDNFDVDGAVKKIMIKRLSFDS